MKDMVDPTYDKNEIAANPIWDLAFKLYEQHNDNSPIGWGDYIPEANKIISE